EAQRLHDEHRIDAGERRNREQHRHHERRHEHAVARRGANGSGFGDRGHQRSFPKRPAGRTSKTMTMMTKITVLDASGQKYFVSPSTMPSPNPVRIAPRIDPMPPITTTANTTMMRSAPISGFTW